MFYAPLVFCRSSPGWIASAGRCDVRALPHARTNADCADGLREDGGCVIQGVHSSARQRGCPVASPWHRRRTRPAVAGQSWSAYDDTDSTGVKLIPAARDAATAARVQYSISAVQTSAKPPVLPTISWAEGPWPRFLPAMREMLSMPRGVAFCRQASTRRKSFQATPSLRMRARSVCGLMSRMRAAPCGPSIRPPVCASTRSMC